MPKQLKWNWLESRLLALNAQWLEAECGMYRGKLNDVKRGKTKLTDEELQAVKKTLRFLSQNNK
jgi:hypothetical protein